MKTIRYKGSDYNVIREEGLYLISFDYSENDYPTLTIGLNWGELEDVQIRALLSFQEIVYRIAFKSGEKDRADKILRLLLDKKNKEGS